MPAGDADSQRLDFWLWCARLLRQRADCARLAEQGGIRINRQPTSKAHARVRVGDVLTLPLPGRVLVVEVRALAERRGPPDTVRLLYAERDAPRLAPRRLAPRRLARPRLARPRNRRHIALISRPGVRDDLRGHR